MCCTTYMRFIQTRTSFHLYHLFKETAISAPPGKTVDKGKCTSTWLRHFTWTVSIVCCLKINVHQYKIQNSKILASILFWCTSKCLNNRRRTMTDENPLLMQHSQWPSSLPVGARRSYDVGNIQSSDCGDSGDKEFRRGYGGVWWNLRSAGIWNLESGGRFCVGAFFPQKSGVS